MSGRLAALALFAALAAVPALAEVWGGGYLISVAMRAMLLGVAAVSLNLLIGHAGLVSFGHSAFLAIGAYTAAIAVQEGAVEALPVFALALALAGAFALVTGALALRTTGVSFIMITLAFGQMVFFALQALARYGGDDGLTLWSGLDVFGARTLDDDLGLYMVTLAALIGAWALVNAAAASRFGRVLRAARQNPARTAAMGYDVARHRLAAYALAGVIAAAAGALWALNADFVSPALASWRLSGDLIVMVVLGGMGARNGALVGALAFVALEEALSTLTHDWRLIFGPLLVLAALRFQGGLAGAAARLAR